MSIESHQHAVQTRSTLSADRHGTKASAKTDAMLLRSPGDFSALMNSFSENTSAIETVVPKSTIQTDVPLPLRTSIAPSTPSSIGKKGSEASQNEGVLLHTLKKGGKGGFAAHAQTHQFEPRPIPNDTNDTNNPNDGVDIPDSTDVSMKADALPASDGKDFSELTNWLSEDTSVIDTALQDDTAGITNATNASVQMGLATVLSAPEGRFKPVAMFHANAEIQESSHQTLSTKTIPSDNLAGMASEVLSVGDSAMPLNKHTPTTQSGVSFENTLHDARKSDVKTWSPPLAGTLVQAAGMPEVSAGMRDRLAFQSSSKTETGLEGAFVPYFVPTDSLSPDQQVTATSATVPDTAVAETVTYWATQGVQSAELKLDGFGDKPVEVSISMQGDQAQIAFRSDQPEVRLALENATTQLRDLLADQGLQLAGVSIGGSGRDSAHTHTPRQRTDGKKAVFVKTVATPVAAPGMRHVSVGRSLDVFA